MTSRVVIPQLELEQNDNPVRKVVEKGAKQVSTQIVHATSFSKDGCSFSFQPPSQNTVLDRRIDLVVPFRLVSARGLVAGSKNAGANTNNFGFNETSQLLPVATNAAAPTRAEATIGNLLKMGNNLAPRQLPLASVISNIDVTINGTHFTTDINQYVKALAQYTSPEYRNSVLHGSYHHPDTGNGQYSNTHITPAGGVNPDNNANPLSINNNSGRAGETPRGTYVNSINNDDVFYVRGNAGRDNNTQLTFQFIEPLLISPLCMNYGKGMTNINNIDITIRFRSDLRMLFSLGGGCPAGLTNGAVQDDAVYGVAAGSVIRYNPAIGDAGNDLSVDLEDRPSLRIRNFTPQDDIRIPNEIILDYQQPKRYTTAVPFADLPADGSITANNRRLDQIPECVYLYVKRQFNKEECIFQDSFNRLTNVNITFGNQVGILSGHKKEQLQAVAVENGCDLLDGVEAKQHGYALKLVFGKDIPLMNNESPGTRGDYNIQVSVKCDSEDASTPDVELVELYVMNGQVIVSPNECRVQTGLLDMKDNIEAEDMGHKYSGGDAEIEGGSIFSKVGKFFKKIPHLVVQGVKHLPQAMDTAEKIAGVASKVAPMMGGSETGGSVVGGSMSGGSLTGGSVTGGARKMYHSRR